MRPTLSSLSISLALGGCLLTGCSSRRPIGMGPVPPGERSLIEQALRCSTLAGAEADTGTTDGRREIVLRYPEKDPVAILTVPRRAVSQPTTFRLSAPAGTQRVLAVVTATDAAGRPVTDFRAEPLLLVLTLREGCTPRRPTSPDASFFAYRLAGSDSTFDERGGRWNDARAWEFLWQRTPKVLTPLDHLSGYILAQGRQPQD